MDSASHVKSSATIVQMQYHAMPVSHWFHLWIKIKHVVAKQDSIFTAAMEKIFHVKHAKVFVLNARVLNYVQNVTQLGHIWILKANANVKRGIILIV